MNDQEKKLGKMKEKIILALLGTDGSIKNFLQTLSREEILLVKKILAMSEKEE